MVSTEAKLAVPGMIKGEREIFYYCHIKGTAQLYMDDINIAYFSIIIDKIFGKEIN